MSNNKTNWGCLIPIILAVIGCLYYIFNVMDGDVLSEMGEVIMWSCVVLGALLVVKETESCLGAIIVLAIGGLLAFLISKEGMNYGIGVFCAVAIVIGIAVFLYMHRGD